MEKVFMYVVVVMMVALSTVVQNRASEKER